MSASPRLSIAVHGWTSLRKDTETPRDSRCKLQLQRICGTCKHFQGALRPSGAQFGGRERYTAPCGVFETEKAPRARAWDCKHWARPMAGVDQ